jgi:hypothetical protein
VTTETPTFVPVRGCRRVTEAVLVSGAGGGEAVGVGEGAGELDAGVPTLAVGVDFGEPTAAPMMFTTTSTPTAARTVVQTLWRAGQLLRGG